MLCFASFLCEKWFLHVSTWQEWRIFFHLYYFKDFIVVCCLCEMWINWPLNTHFSLLFTSHNAQAIIRLICFMMTGSFYRVLKEFSEKRQWNMLRRHSRCHLSFRKAHHVKWHFIVDKLMAVNSWNSLNSVALSDQYWFPWKSAIIARTLIISWCHPQPTNRENDTAKKKIVQPNCDG